MKRAFFLSWIVTMLVAGVQCAAAQDWMETDFGARLRTADLLGPGQTSVSEIVKGNIGLSGVAVEVFKAENPLQLINPFAPERYCATESNTLRDSVTEQAVGLKFLSIRF